MKKYYRTGSEYFSADEVAPEEPDLITVKAVTEEDEKEKESIVTIGLRKGQNDSLTYPEFLERLTEDIKATGYTDEDLRIRKNEKDQDVLEIRSHAELSDGIIAMQIYLMDLYGAYLEYGYETVIRQLLQKIRETDQSFDRVNLNEVAIDADYQDIREDLIVRPLNFSRYAGKLMNGIYQKHGDVALVLYRVLLDTEENLLTHMVLKEELEEWGQKGNENRILSDALKRTAEKYPAVILDKEINDGVDLLHGNYRREDVIIPGGAILISSSRGINGAAAMFYPGVSAKIAELMHGKFAAVFMNTTDVMIVRPDSPYLKGYMEFASHDNEAGEMLSGRRYLFDRKGELLGA